MVPFGKSWKPLEPSSSKKAKEQLAKAEGDWLWATQRANAVEGWGFGSLVRLRTQEEEAQGRGPTFMFEQIEWFKESEEGAPFSDTYGFFRLLLHCNSSSWGHGCHVMEGYKGDDQKFYLGKNKPVSDYGFVVEYWAYWPVGPDWQP